MWIIASKPRNNVVLHYIKDVKLMYFELRVSITQEREQAYLFTYKDEARLVAQLASRFYGIKNYKVVKEEGE